MAITTRLTNTRHVFAPVMKVTWRVRLPDFGATWPNNPCRFGAEMITVFEWAVKHGVGQNALGELLGILDPVRPAFVSAGKATSEAAVQAMLQIEAAKRGGALWRNNSGACVDQDGRQVRYGLGNTSAKLNDHFKSSDLIGITPLMVTSASVGQIVGVFTAIEVKAPGWQGPREGHNRESSQNNYLKAVRALGGIGKFAQSTQDVYK